MIDPNTIREYLRRLGHRVALVGLKPINGAPRTTVIWPAEQDDIADQAAWLSSSYWSVYVNLNPLRPELLDVVPSSGRSACDAMIARRTRVLIDVDAHSSSITKGEARRQAEAVIAEIGPPLIYADSGNGYAIIYPCDVPADLNFTEKTKLYLRRLKDRYPAVDAGVYTLSRLTRLIGTPNRCKITGERARTELLN